MSAERVQTSSLPAGWQLDVTSDPATMKQDWERLAVASRNVFASWPWAEAWVQTIGADDEHIVVTARDRAGDARVLLPLTVTSRGGIRVLRFIGHGPGDELGPVAAEDDAAIGLDCLREAIGLPDIDHDLFLAERMAPGSARGWSSALVLGTEPSPVVAAPDGWEAYLKRLSSNLRSQIRSKERKLAREHDLQFRFSRDVEADLNLLFELHRQRWGEERTSFGSAEAFHRRFATEAADRGWLRLWVMELDGEPVAAWYGFRFAGVESYYQGGRDPDRARESLGFVLLAHTIRTALEDGVAEYRLLRGDEDYKERFATLQPMRETFAVPRTTVGRAAVRAGSFVREHEPLRRLTRSLLG